jgi:hypothetical protein
MAKPSKERSILPLLALSALLATAALAAEPGEPIAGDVDLTVKQQQGVPYVSGGVGDEEQDAMRGARGRFNLRVNLATTDGKSLGGGSIRIEDQQGRTVLDTPTNGPVLLANLPPG